MDNAIRVFSGRTFSPEDIEMIKWARTRYPGLSRSELAGTVCEILNWNTSSGCPKMQQCMDFFDILEAEGIVRLPPSGGRNHTGGDARMSRTKEKLIKK